MSVYRVLALFVVLVLPPALGLALSGRGDVPSSWLLARPETDFEQRSVDLAEILSGGPPKDGIPSIDAPRFRPVAEAAVDLAPTEPVMSVSVDGAVTEFGTTGKLRHSDLVMYDRVTESWWQQFEGRAIVSERVGTRLRTVLARIEWVALFQERQAEGLMLVPPGADRAYGRNPYVGYDQAPAPLLDQGRYDGTGSPLMRVVGVEGLSEAWSLDLLRERGQIIHGEVVIRWQAGQNSALDHAEIAAGRDVGNVTVQRRTADGGLVDVVYDVPFAFALEAFGTDVTIWHVDEAS